METDRELLELAAKAAGIACDEKGPYTESPCIQSEFGRGNWIENVRRDWAPLADDGDAMRLAVKLSIHLTNSAIDAWASSAMITEIERFGSDPYAATRRAIVRCAAEIWRTK